MLLAIAGLFHQQNRIEYANHVIYQQDLTADAAS